MTNSGGLSSDFRPQETSSLKSELLHSSAVSETREIARTCWDG